MALADREDVHIRLGHVQIDLRAFVDGPRARRPARSAARHRRPRSARRCGRAARPASPGRACPAVAARSRPRYRRVAAPPAPGRHAARAHRRGSVRRSEPSPRRIRPSSTTPSRMLISGWPSDARHERVGGPPPDLLRRADLDQPALAQHRDAVPERQRLLVVVRDIEGRGVRHRAELFELGPHRRAQLGVEVAQRLVEQVDVRGPDQHPAQRDPLPLPVGQLTGKALEQVVDSQRGGHLVDAFGALASRCTCRCVRTSAARRGSRCTVFCGYSA